MDIAALGLSVKFDQVEGATVALKEQTKAASASERAAQQWGLANKEAGRTADDFSKRVQTTIRNLEFERQQMARTAAEQERFTALRRAGVSASSAEGQAISEHIRQLQAQREAQKAAAESARLAQQQAAGFAALAKQQAAEQAAAAQAVSQAKAVEMRAAQARQAQADALVAKQVAHEAQRKAVVQSTIADINFETQQLGRNAIQRERHLALRRAGVAAESAEGKAVLASVAALQAQRAAVTSAGKSIAGVAEVSASARHGVGLLARAFGPLAAVAATLSPVIAMWSAGMKAADFGEQAEQIGVTTDQLQAYRFAGAQAGIQTEQIDTAFTRLTKTMGEAAKGGKEQIELFDRLGVKLLDANGELRPVADVLPEVARGVLEIGSSSQRTATLMELFGRSGAKMATVLGEIAQGNDDVVAKARAAGAILDEEVIAAWDRVSDSLTRAKLAADTTFAKLGAPIATSALEAIEKLLKSINEVMDQINSKDGFWASVLEESRSKGRIGTGPNALRLETPAEKNARLIAEKQKELGTPAAQGREAMIQAEIDRLSRDGIIARQAGMESDDEWSRRHRLPAVGPASGGSRNPVAKGGGSDPYAKAIESAREYVLSKKAETEAVGQTVLAAARLKHEQDLLNKATGEGKTLSDAQKAALQSLSVQMAEADNALATAKFIDEYKTKAEEFLAQQEMERQALFMSAQAADALRFSTEMLNAAKRQGTELTPAHIEAIKATADAMAASKAKTDELKEIVGLGRDVFKGFFSDMREGLMNGQTIWQSFGDAAVNALNRIAEKLIEMAATQLFEAAFPSGSGGGGGGGGILNLLGGGSSGTSSGLLDGIMSAFNFFPTFSKGAAFRGGNVIPFARGDVFSSPTMFPMSGGRRGVMGEAGDEAIMPLHRGSDGGLGVRMSGGRGAAPQPVVVHVYANEGFVRAEAEGAAVRVVNDAAPGIVKTAVKKSGEQAPGVMARHEAQRGGEWR